MKSWVPREFKQTYYSTKSPLNRRFFDRQTTHFSDPLVLAINYTSRLTATGTGQLSGATRAIIINQACPTSAGALAELRGFLHLPRRARKSGRRECRLCNLSRTTFSSADAYYAVDSIFQGNRSPRQALSPFCFLREALSISLLSANANISALPCTATVPQLSHNQQNDIIVQNNSNFGYSANKRGNISLRKLINFVECFTD